VSGLLSPRVDVVPHHRGITPGPIRGSLLPGLGGKIDLTPGTTSSLPSIGSTVRSIMFVNHFFRFNESYSTK
jgi:hypothetical protein